MIRKNVEGIRTFLHRTSMWSRSPLFAWKNLGFSQVGGALLLSSAQILPKSREIEGVVYPENLKLQLVQIITRHGDRTPVTDWRSHNHHNHSWKCLDNSGDELVDCFSGQLTEIGKSQHKELGKTLRKKYVDELQFLPSSFDSEQFGVRSTSYSRTIQSANNLLSQLVDNWDEEMERNIEVSHPEVIESLFLVCPNMVKRWKSFNDSQESKEYRLQNVDPLKVEMKNHLQTPKKSGETGLIDLFDYFTTVSSHGLELPENVTPHTIDKMGDVSYRHYWHPFSDPSVARLGLGLFLKELNARMQEKMNDQTKKKFILYSAHDSTIGPLMAALHVGDKKWPPYASSFTIELFQDNNLSVEPHSAASHQNSDFYIRFLYQNKPVFFQGHEFTPLEVVQNHIKPLIPGDWHKECTEDHKK